MVCIVGSKVATGAGSAAPNSARSTEKALIYISHERRRHSNHIFGIYVVFLPKRELLQASKTGKPPPSLLRRNEHMFVSGLCETEISLLVYKKALF